MTARDLVERTEQRRNDVSSLLDDKHRATWGQFFTPAPVADFLADLIDLPAEGSFSLLDPGAGVGSLSAAVAAKAVREESKAAIRIVAFEADEPLLPQLSETLRDCEETAAAGGVALTTDLRPVDFVAWASASLRGSVFATADRFNACVMNPPYRKINSRGTDRLALESVGLKVTNLYAGFLGLGAALLEPGGQLSAITPRSFANGPYFLPFRRFFLERMRLDRLHVYERRGRVFADADVLQENVVLKATRSQERRVITLSVSEAHGDEPLSREVPHVSVVRPDDPMLFVHIPVDEADVRIAERVASLPATLDDLRVKVSTGRVVDFRARDHLLHDPDPDAAPLIYPSHLRQGRVCWPVLDGRKPNALARNDETEGLLLPAEHYALVKRFTAKEERRRVVAAMFEPDDVPSPVVAVENHLNVYHRDGRGLPREIALGLVAFLNSSTVDTYIRQFSGHTQINATDLRLLRYPSLAQLTMLGGAADGADLGDQAAVDALVAAYVPAFAESETASAAGGDAAAS